MAADDLLHDSATPVMERLTGATLASLTPDLLGLAQLCAVLGDPMAIDDVDGVQRRLGPDTVGHDMDASVGLSSTNVLS